MWTPALGRFWRKKLKKQFDLDGINENAEEKAARAKGVGAPLHLEVFDIGDKTEDDVIAKTSYLWVKSFDQKSYRVDPLDNSIKW